MEWLRRILLRWLVPDLDERLKALEASHRLWAQTATDVSDLRHGLSETISELNALRNQKADQPQVQPANLRKFSTWAQTKAALEGRQIPGAPQPIPHERTA